MKFSPKHLFAASVLFLSVALPAAAAPIVYMTGTGNPWGVSGNGSNEQAMDTAFGAGKWSKVNGFGMAAFAADTRFLYLDGGDSSAVQFSTFLAANQAAIGSFVSNGGALFLNAAPNIGGSFSMGFGTMLNNGNSTGNAQATAAGVASGIFDDIVDAYTGGSFSHAYVSGDASFVSLMNDHMGRSVFGGKEVGNGYVAFGGMTLPYFHGPGADSRLLRANMLNYVADQGNQVPEPGSLLLVGLGLGIAALSRRRKA
ncbi:MAG: PEP-CTERM sorting domain-containing protein [Telluria sp.]